MDFIALLKELVDFWDQAGFYKHCAPSGAANTPLADDVTLVNKLKNVFVIERNIELA